MMSIKAELQIRKADENDVIPILLSSESGFREDPQESDFRKPLEWDFGIGEAFALIGIIVSVAQLAISIYEILQKEPDASIVIVLEPSKKLIIIEGKDRSPENIAQQINENIDDD
jgi:hypothetical protein